METTIINKSEKHFSCSVAGELLVRYDKSSTAVTRAMPSTGLWSLTKPAPPRCYRAL